MNKLMFVYRIFLYMLYLSLLTILIYTCLQTGNDSGDLSTKVANYIAKAQSKITGRNVEVTKHYRVIVRKLIGHFLFYMAFGIVSILTVLSITKLPRNIRITLHYVIGIFLAFFTEFVLQAHTAGRTPALADVGLNMLGYMSASTILVMVYIFGRYGKPRTNLPKNTTNKTTITHMSDEKIDEIVLKEASYSKK